MWLVGLVGVNGVGGVGGEGELYSTHGLNGSGEPDGMGSVGPLIFEWVTWG